ncbi:MAG: DUF2007 domain-containing protein [Draconibacterium sp.]|nr:DUF2007 domain-containing protein [Draconibacterium sp.]
MEKLITVAVFTNPYDVKLSLYKDMLEQGGIKYIVSNENARVVEPLTYAPSNISIEIKVYERYIKEALEILNSIE